MPEKSPVPESINSTDDNWAITIPAIPSGVRAKGFKSLLSVCVTGGKLICCRPRFYLLCTTPQACWEEAESIGRGQTDTLKA